MWGGAHACHEGLDSACAVEWGVGTESEPWALIPAPASPGGLPLEGSHRLPEPWSPAP